jgi:hypothetical protein
MNTEEIKKLAKDYSSGKSSAQVFKEAHEVDFIAGFNKCLGLNATKPFTPEITAKEEADYKTILEKYLHHVMVCEGSDYVEHCTSPSVVFTESEWNVLKQLSKQVNGLNPYPTTK